VSALREIGVMDESYQAYVEDSEWSLRAQKKGWESLFIPVPSIIHHEEETGYEYYSFKSFLLKRNTVKWFLAAGMPISAWLYAICSVALAHLRTWLCFEASERNKYRLFVSSLRSAFGELLFENSTTHANSPLSRSYEMGLIDERRDRTL
jgi:GT2 family glycosyltransferase